MHQQQQGMQPQGQGHQPIQRTGTFFVEADRQRHNLEGLQRRKQQLAEVYTKNKPLCFSGSAYQKTHPFKAQKGRKDADVTLATPVMCGVADGVSQIEDFGIDASRLPKELLRHCQYLGDRQLRTNAPGTYRGPIPLVREAFERTAPILGSTTLVLAVLDNSTKIHGKLHPMIAVIAIGDCELLVLRRLHGAASRLTPVFQTEMQRIDGHLQTPLQLARVDDRIDANFHDGITIEVIERGSAVHCISAYEGDIVLMGSDGVFDNLFTDEIAEMVNAILRPNSQQPIDESLLHLLSRRIVEACHAKTRPGPTGVLPEAPIGRGGKVDDTSCVVAEVIELIEGPEGPHAWQSSLSSQQRDVVERDDIFTGFLRCGTLCDATDKDEVNVGPDGRKQRGGRKGQQQGHTEEESSETDDEASTCCIS